MSESGAEPRSPKAIIHKQILEVADAEPAASIEAIAEDISGATPDLVERVLDTYGDPGEEHSASADSSQNALSEEPPDDSPGFQGEEADTAPAALEPGGSSDDDEGTTDASLHTANPGSDGQSEESDMSEPNSESVSLDFEALSTNQRTVLEAIREHPDATQRELAEQFDVTPATISRWVNDIPGFEWQDRQTFVAQQLAATETVSDGGGQSGKAVEDSPETDPRLDELEAELATLHDRLDALKQAVSDDVPESSPLDANLFAKVIRACLDDERIDEAEADAIITALR